MNELYAALSKALEGDLPGWESQKRMINYDRPPPKAAAALDPEAKQGSVLALLYPKNSVTHIALMLRPTYKGAHSGQVSFPGGKREKTDGDLWDTALREANEELGIEPSKVLKVGRLTQVYIPPSRFLVSPFVGVSHEQPQFKIDPIEVKSLIEVPFAHFMKEDVLGEKPVYVSMLNQEVPVKYYSVNGYTVWGATAMMLSELTDIIKNHKIQI